MSKKVHCLECKFANVKDADTIKATRTCRKFAPTEKGKAIWPIVQGYNWCGEGEAKDE